MSKVGVAEDVVAETGAGAGVAIGDEPDAGDGIDGLLIGIDDMLSLLPRDFSYLYSAS